MDWEDQYERPVNIDRHKYPYSIVWTAVPCVTCCFPCFGHAGICKSDGNIYDFVRKGPMHSGKMEYGSPLKYLVLEHKEYSAKQWNAAIDRVNKKFQKTDHNIITNNCHHHVAEVLNELKYKGKSDWGQVDIAIMLLKATHTRCISFYVYFAFLALVVYLLL